MYISHVTTNNELQEKKMALWRRRVKTKLFNAPSAMQSQKIIGHIKKTLKSQALFLRVSDLALF